MAFDRLVGRDIGYYLLSCAVRDASEHSYFFIVLVRDNHIINAGFAVQDLFLGYCRQDVANAGRGAISYGAIESQGAVIA
nr:hypothetical protein [uncultured bacterium]